MLASWRVEASTSDVVQSSSCGVFGFDPALRSSGSEEWKDSGATGWQLCSQKKDSTVFVDAISLSKAVEKCWLRDSCDYKKCDRRAEEFTTFIETQCPKTSTLVDGLEITFKAVPSGTTIPPRIT